MDRAEFETLRALGDKQITVDIRFAKSRSHPASWRSEGIVVVNATHPDLVLDITYKPAIPSASFNFSVRSSGGAICRLDINGTIHKDQGRTHKHELQRGSDVRNNLPYAVARPGLAALPLEQVWDWLCGQAGITHAGAFILPVGD